MMEGPFISHKPIWVPENFPYTSSSLFRINHMPFIALYMFYKSSLWTHFACCFITNSTKTWHVGWVSPCVHPKAWHKYVGFLWYGQTCCKHSFPYVSCIHIHTYKPPHTNAHTHAHMSTHAHTHTLLIVYVYNWSYCNDCLCNMHCNICFDNTF